MNSQPTPEQLRLASLVVACMAAYELIQSWIVYAAGSLEDVSCSGRYQRLFCEAGSVLGRLFEPYSPWLGYVLLEGLFGVVFLSLAWLTYVRSKA